MSKERTYTKAGYEALLAEMSQLEDLIEKNKKDISTARAYGDLSENSEYSEAKEEQRKLAFRKEELQDMIKNAVVVEEGELDASVIGIGSFIKVFCPERGRELEYHMVGSYEVDSFAGKISDQSPIGLALLGKRVGDKVEAELPNGTVIHLEVRDVHR